MFGASVGAATFIVWKIRNTPDVQINPAAPPHYEEFKGQPQHHYNTKSRVL